MKAIIVVLALLCLAELGVIGFLMTLCEGEKEARLRAIRGGYPWDWTRESEKQVQAAMEMICDKCHEPHRCGREEIEQECDMCPIRDVLYRVAGHEEI